jgi:hypothetical protein
MYVLSNIWIQGYANISQIPNPLPHSAPVYSSTINALSHCPDIPEPEASNEFEKLRGPYSCASPGLCPNRKVNIECIQHPTITVCLQLLRGDNSDKHPVLIGPSNYSCCRWCEIWCRLAFPKVSRFKPRGECPEDWLYPETFRRGLQSFLCGR